MQEIICGVSGTSFPISSEMETFLDTISPSFGGKKYSIFHPKRSPEERMRRRLAFRNERALYHRKCEVTGNQVISIYSPERGFKVLSQKAWWGDAWDGKKYGRDFDFSRNFTHQFKELLFDVPRMNLVQQGQSVNADYCNCVSDNKNSYLIFNASDNDACSYGAFLLNCKNTYDSLTVYVSENCYECIDCTKCYECFYCQDTKNSSNMHFCYDCQDCKNCFSCVGLRGKQDGFYILNQKVTQEAFEEVLKSRQKQKDCLQYLEKLYFQIPKKFSQILLSEKSSGCYIEQVKNSTDCWDCMELENCHFCNNFMFAKNCYDASYYGVTQTNEFVYECEGIGHGIYNIKFCKLVWGDTKNMMYCYECFNCEDCFGCTGLKSQKYCIFNKQFTPETYEKTVAKIIEHMQSTQEWGEFFDPSISPFGYNETVANDFFPLSQDTAKKMGFNWREDTVRSSYVGTIYTPLEISSYNAKIVGQEVAQKNIADCLAGVFECPISKKNFRLTPQELQFYIQYGIEIPSLHPDERYKKRLQKRLPRQLYERNCEKCGVTINSPYSAKKKELVYCEECYNREIF